MTTSLQMKKLTPVLYVERIEPCLELWLALGFQKGVEVPEGDALGFVSLAKDGVELMYQSRASLAKDLPGLAGLPSATTLYFEVNDLDALIAAVSKAPSAFPRRKTFYGADEIGFRDAAGNVVIFSSHA